MKVASRHISDANIYVGRFNSTTATVDPGDQTLKYPRATDEMIRRQNQDAEGSPDKPLATAGPSSSSLDQVRLHDCCMIDQSS